MLKLINNIKLREYLSLNESAKIVLYYDGECPICQKYQQYLDIRKKYDITIQNAREDLPYMTKLAESGCDINQGMILVIDDMILQGEKALGALAILSGSQGFLDSLLSKAMKNKVIRLCFYPVIKGIRKVLLFFLGVKNIDVSRK